MGSIYKRGTKFWIRYTDRKSGRLVRRSAGTTRMDAVLALREVEGDQRPGKGRGPTGGPPFEDLVNSYREYLKVHAKPTTVKQTESCFRKLLNSFAGKVAASLSLKDFDAFIALRQEAGVKPRTINTDLIILRAILNHAVRVGLLDSLPFKVRLMKAPKKRVLPVLGSDEIRRLLEHAYDPHYGILLVASQTGFRLSEILHLTWKDVYWGEGALAVTSKNGWSAKNHQERTVYVSRQVLDYLKSRKKESRHEYVFSTRNGTPWNVGNVGDHMRKIFKEAGIYRQGIPVTHWIRHSACSRMLAAGMDIETVRVIMGHADASTTMLYAHTDEDRLGSTLISRTHPKRPIMAVEVCHGEAKEVFRRVQA